MVDKGWAGSGPVSLARMNDRSRTQRDQGSTGRLIAASLSEPALGLN